MCVSKHVLCCLEEFNEGQFSYVSFNDFTKKALLKDMDMCFRREKHVCNKKGAGVHIKLKWGSFLELIHYVNFQSKTQRPRRVF